MMKRKLHPKKMLLPTTPHHASENLMSILQLLDAIIKKVSLSLGRQGFRSNSLNLNI